MPYQPGIRTALKDWGLTVVEVAGWETRGDPYFQPHGHVLHHDVIADQTGTSDRVPSLIVVGRSDLPGPLCNFWLERDGNVHLVAAGEANHAGEGGWRGLSGNHSVWGTEMNNLGTPADPWPDAQLEAMVRLAAATAEFSGFDASYVCGHKEWAPDRKIDPHTIDMGTFRGRVAAASKEGLTVADIEELKDTIKAQGKLTRRTVQRQGLLTRRQAAVHAKATQAELDEIDEALAALGDEGD